MKTFLLLISILLLQTAMFAQTGPELTFTNPTLVSGTANKQGAIYRFSNITPGVDGEMKLRKFSRNDIVMANVDNSTFGWDKAFQPEFGLAGLVPANQNWYVDFELTFYNAGTNVKRKMDTVNLTALDVDGDGQAISEYVTYENPNSVLYSTLTFLTSNIIGNIGQVFECERDHLSSPLIACLVCGGDGELHNGDECSSCEGSGKKHLLCGHPYEGASGNTVLGPVNNFVNIDTAATQVMATYQFLNKDRIRFRYGAKTNNNSSNGAGVRLNSTWFRRFSMSPISVLPVKLTSFTALLKTDTRTELKWVSAEESNLSHYVVERSTDGANYTDAGTVFGMGNNSSQASYSFADNISAVQSKIIYYRIRSVDNDGKVSLSEVRIIRLSKQSSDMITVMTYPNPVSNDLRITLPGAWQNKTVVYELFALNGQLVHKSASVTASQTEVKNIAGLQSGVYNLRVTCEGQTGTQKIVKQ